MKKLMAGNWKMYKGAAEAASTAAELVGLTAGKVPADRAVLLIPSFTALSAVGQALAGSDVRLGAQNFYPSGEGAFTGEVAPTQLLDVGCAYALAGHSERRHVIGESDEFVGRKVTFGLAAGLRMILCIGETIDERRTGQVEAVCSRQLRAGLAGVPADVDPDDIVIAYEPVWAIGTGLVAGPEDILAAHAFVRSELEKLFPGKGGEIGILYGGSVKPDNAAKIIGLDNVDGVLVGGASLRAGDFAKIVLA